MALVEANCIAEAFDNQNQRLYYRGIVKDFDTSNEKLACLTTLSGLFVFQYKGHEGVSQDWLDIQAAYKGKKVAQIQPEQQPITTRPDRRYRKKSPAAIKQMLETRKKNQDAKLAKLSASE